MNSNKVISADDVVNGIHDELMRRTNFTSCLIHGLSLSGRLPALDDVVSKAYLVASIFNYRGDVGGPIKETMKHFHGIVPGDSDDDAC